MSMFDRLPQDQKALGALCSQAIKQLQDTLDEGTRRNTREVLDKVEDLNTKLISERAARKRMEEAMRTGAKIGPDGEIDYSRTGWGTDDDPEYKTFMHFLLHGKVSEFCVKSVKGNIVGAKWDRSQIDMKTLRTDNLTAGGYLVPQIMDDQIRKNITEVSPVRMHAKVRTALKKAMDVPRRLSLPLAQFEGEAEAAPTDQSIYGSEQVTCYRQTVKVPGTEDMMLSSAFDLEREIAGDVGKSFAQGEGLNFVAGNGRKGPQGFVSDNRVVGYTSGTSASFTIDDLPKMAAQLKRGQNPWWYMNRARRSGV